MEGIKPPGNLQLEGNVDENLCAFKQRFLPYLTAIGAWANSGTRKVAMLLTVAGPQAIEVYNRFMFEEEDKNDLDKVLKLFDDFFKYCADLYFAPAFKNRERPLMRF